jgi:hypothetical protein
MSIAGRLPPRLAHPAELVEHGVTVDQLAPHRLLDTDRDVSPQLAQPRLDLPTRNLAHRLFRS